MSKLENNQEKQQEEERRFKKLFQLGVADVS